MTELEQYCRTILDFAEEKPTSVKVYSYPKGLVLHVATEKGDRKQAIDKMGMSTDDTTRLLHGGYLEYKKSELEVACLAASTTGYAKIFTTSYYDIAITFNDRYRQVLAVNSEVLWTLQEVELFKENGFIEFGVDKNKWVKGDIVRNIQTMIPVSFTKFSLDGSFFFCKEMKGAQRTARYNKLPGDQVEN